MPPRGKRNQQLAKNTASVALGRSKESVATCAPRPRIWSRVGQKEFEAKYVTFAIKNPLIDAKRFAHFMTAVIVSKCCAACMAVTGAPNGLLARGIKSKGVAAMKAELRLHGISTDGKPAAALKLDVNALVDLGAKVLCVPILAEPTQPIHASSSVPSGASAGHAGPSPAAASFLSPAPKTPAYKRKYLDELQWGLVGDLTPTGEAEVREKREDRLDRKLGESGLKLSVTYESPIKVTDFSWALDKSVWSDWHQEGLIFAMYMILCRRTLRLQKYQTAVIKRARPLLGCGAGSVPMSAACAVLRCSSGFAGSCWRCCCILSESTYCATMATSRPATGC